MANWAIVIGIDAYEGASDAAGAVAAADPMADWLVDPQGGGVPERNLIRRLGEPRQPAGATYAHVVTALHDVVDRAGGGGERLFVVFSGRGLETRLGRYVLCLQDFAPDRTTCSLELGELVTLFATTAFREQFWLVDGGVSPVAEDFAVGAPPRLPYHPGGPRATPDQYVCRPAAPPADVEVPPQQGGRLLPALLAGLGAAGPARRWDDSRRREVVRWSSLAEHLGERAVLDGPARPGADAVLAVLGAARPPADP